MTINLGTTVADILGGAINRTRSCRTKHWFGYVSIGI